MRIYLDNTCLNRPFDDQRQFRVRLEADAIVRIMKRIDSGEWEQVSSDMATIEINALVDDRLRSQVAMLMPETAAVMPLSPAMIGRADQLEQLGFKPADALHLAAAEAALADIFLTCDPRVTRLARRNKRRLTVKVANPLD